MAYVIVETYFYNNHMYRTIQNFGDKQNLAIIYTRQEYGRYVTLDPIHLVGQEYFGELNYFAKVTKIFSCQHFVLHDILVLNH